MLQTVIIEMYTSYNLKLPCIQLSKLLPELLGLMQCHVPIYLHIYKWVFCVRIHIIISLYTIAMMWCYAFYQRTCNIQLIFKLLVPNLHTSLAVHCEAMSLLGYLDSDVHYIQTHVHSYTSNTLCILLVHLCTSHVLKWLWVGGYLSNAYNTIVYTHCCSLLPALHPTPQDSGLHCSHWL